MIDSKWRRGRVGIPGAKRRSRRSLTKIIIMAVRKKGLRKVKYKGRHYYWHVNEKSVTVPEEGFVSYPVTVRQLHIISADKQFIIHYRIPEPGDPHTEIQVEGPNFPRAPGVEEVAVPRWRHDSKRYPTADFVRRLIGWCMEVP